MVLNWLFTLSLSSQEFLNDGMNFQNQKKANVLLYSRLNCTISNFGHFNTLGVRKIQFCYGLISCQRHQRHLWTLKQNIVDLGQFSRFEGNGMYHKIILYWNPFSKEYIQAVFSNYQNCAQKLNLYFNCTWKRKKLVNSVQTLST